MSFNAAEHKVRLLLLDPHALAEQRLMDFVEEISYVIYHDSRGMECTYPRIPFDEFMERASEFQEGGSPWHNDRFIGVDLYGGFWNDFTVVTGIALTNTNTFLLAKD